MKDSELPNCSIDIAPNFYVRLVQRDGGSNSSRKAELANLGAGITSLSKCPTINGGDGANDDITIQGTSHSTRTSSYVVLQPNGGNVGIGTTSPGELLELGKSASGAIGPVIKLRNKAGGAADKAYVDFATSNLTDGTEIRARLGMHILEFGQGRLDFYTKSSQYVFESTPDVTIVAGKMGIGTISPGAPLAFANAGGEKIRFYSDDTQAKSYGIAINANEFNHNVPSNAWFSFSVNGISKFEIDSSGGVYFRGTPTLYTPSYAAQVGINNLLFVNGSGHANPHVGIGTASPTEKLEVSGNIKLSGSVITPGVVAGMTSTKTSSYTATDTDHTIVCDGTFTVSLPAASGKAGRIYIIKNIGTGTVTVDGNASEPIDGATTYTLNSQYQVVRIQCNAAGTGWYVI